MFRHQGKARSFKHNLQLASLLSFVAGSVNVIGFLAVQRLTTNVTGHFAFFIDEVFKLHFQESLSYFFYILFFFLGSFLSGFLVEFNHARHNRSEFAYPILLEGSLLILAGIMGSFLTQIGPHILAYVLLFSMGLQNALVTKISNAMVRTTHLTGLFTDLGIELSQLFFYKEQQQRTQLSSSIKLRLTIICFFFLGGISGGVLFTSIGLMALCITAALLLAGLLADNVKLHYIKLKRKHD